MLIIHEHVWQLFDPDMVSFNIDIDKSFSNETEHPRVIIAIRRDVQPLFKLKENIE